ncbi:nitrous oxide reductase accessory protein NosL [Zoogloea sp. LCSB751]|uniref:nitrous oxide reductase accessory protein NosL n=1 Tax=Zoogloea sp. LCSB751 TaxID=1965277 RepID=UPI0009A5334F|nr:nitrous oxide reductase accessory protein NosL [Zoogloea sp. LCSB751]
MKRPSPFRTLPRLAAVLLACGLLTACGKTMDNSVAPTELGKDTYCALDGMLLGDYPGPKAQIHYAGQPEPEFFCDTMEMFSIYLKPEQARKVAAIYVQDLDKTTWEEPKGAWIDAKTAFYVVGSKKRAAMGPTLPSFGTREGAQKFAAAEGGKVLAFSEVTPEMARLDGGALHDQRM